MSKGENIENKNVDDKNEGVGGNVRVWVRVREVPPSVYFHFQQFYHSTYLLFCFSTFRFSIFLSFDIFTFDISWVNR